MSLGGPPYPRPASDADDGPLQPRAIPALRFLVTHQIEFTAPGSGFATKVWISAGILPAPAADAGRIVEVFLRGQGRVGSERDFLLDDVAVLISHLLRLGMTPTGVRKLLGASLNNGEPASIVAAACDELVRMQRQIVDGDAA